MRVRRLLRRAGLPGYYERAFWRTEFRCKAGLGVGRRVSLLRKGFNSDKYILYALNQNSIADYVSDYTRFQSARINRTYGELLDNKIVFPAFIRSCLDAPTNLGLIVRGRLMPLEAPAIVTWELLLERCREVGGVVLKPFTGDGGKGIIVVTWTSDGYLMDCMPTDEQTIITRFRKLNNCLVTERLIQSEFGDSLYPYATNTMRILTMIDPESGQAFIPAAAQRIGTDRSRPIDNFGQGGISANIDLETGALGPAAAAPQGKANLEWHDRHPDSGGPIAGQVVPGWPEVCRRIQDAAERLAYLPLIGWDAVITRTGLAVIEGNSWPGVRPLQIHRPLLRDERVRRFLEHHGLL